MAIRRPRALTVFMCAYLGLTVLGFHGTAALLPRFIEYWHLSATQAGWLLGVLSLAALLASPLIALTDRVDTRWVLLAGTGFNVVGYAGFGLFADGLVSAMVCRALVGVGFVLSYMPGVKALGDRIAPEHQAKATSTYVSSFSICSSLSVAIAGTIASYVDWRWAYLVPAISNAVAGVLVVILLAPAKPVPAGGGGAPTAGVFDFRAIIGNRPAMGFMAGNFAHSVELLALRGWTVAFLTYVATLHPGVAPTTNLSLIATALILLGVPSGMIGGALGARYGLATVAMLALGASGVVGLCVGFTATWPYWLFFCGPLVLHNILVMADAGALSAGVMSRADPQRRGSTVAFYTMVGSVGSFLGPVLLGSVLDLAGGRQSTLAWGFGFASVGVVCVGCALLLHRLAGRGTAPT